MAATLALVKRKTVLWLTVSWLQTIPLTQALVEVVLMVNFVWELAVHKLSYGSS